MNFYFLISFHYDHIRVQNHNYLVHEIENEQNTIYRCQNNYEMTIMEPI